MQREKLKADFILQLSALSIKTKSPNVPVSAMTLNLQRRRMVFPARTLPWLRPIALSMIREELRFLRCWLKRILQHHEHTRVTFSIYDFPKKNKSKSATNFSIHTKTACGPDTFFPIIINLKGTRIRH